jgi:hypothetical protein
MFAAFRRDNSTASGSISKAVQVAFGNSDSNETPNTPESGENK